jgi:hypothetical protein
MLRIILGFLLFTALLSAQTVIVNGSTTAAAVPLGGTLAVSVSGTAYAPHWWGFSTNPGPIVAGPLTIPIGYGPTFIDVGMGSPLPANGLRQESVPVPQGPYYGPDWWYSAAVVAAPAAPMGFTASNGVAFRFADPFTNAGADGATLVNEALTLDGSLTRDPSTGQIVPGTNLQWAITAAPVGAIASLSHANSEFPVFTTSMAGVYTITLQTQGPNGFGEDSCTVHVWDLRFTAPAGGWFSTVPVGVTGLMIGPPAQSFTVDGNPVGTLGILFSAGNITPTGTLRTITARVEAPSGAFVTRSATLTQGVGVSGASWNASGVVLRLSSAGLDGFEPTLQQQLAGMDLNTMIQALPNVNAVNAWPAATATVNPNGGSFNTTNVGFDWWPTASGINFNLTLHNVVMYSTVFGEIFFINYSEPAVITASSAVLTGVINIAPGAGNAVTASVSNLNATLNGFYYSMGGVLNTITQLSLIQDAIRSSVESAIEGMGPSIPSYINPLLAAFTLTSNLNQYGIPMIVEFPIAQVVHDTSGGTLRNNFRATVTATDPITGQFTNYRGTSSTVIPSFGATTPSGTVYDMALAINDDVLNLLLLQLTRSGTLNLDVTGTVGTPPNNLILTAQAMDLLVPGAGFGLFPPTANVRVRMRHVSAPTIVFTPGTTRQGTLFISGTELSADVETAPGVFKPIFAASLNGDCGISLDINTASNTLVIVVHGPTLQLTPVMRRSFPGTDPTASLTGLAQVMQFLLPMVVGPLAQIPVPSTPVGNPVVLSVSGQPAAPDYLNAWMNF